MRLFLFHPISFIVNMSRFRSSTRLDSPNQNLTLAYDGADDPNSLISSQVVPYPFPLQR